MFKNKTYIWDPSPILTWFWKKSQVLRAHLNRAKAKIIMSRTIMVGMINLDDFKRTPYYINVWKTAYQYTNFWNVWRWHAFKY